MATEWDDVLVRAGFASVEGEQAWESLAVPDALDLDSVLDELTFATVDLVDDWDDDVLFAARARRTTGPDRAEHDVSDLDGTAEETEGPASSGDDATAEVDPALDPTVPPIEPIEPDFGAAVDLRALDEDERPEDEDSIDLELSEIELPDEP